MVLVEELSCLNESLAIRIGMTRIGVMIEAEDVFAFAAHCWKPGSPAIPSAALAEVRVSKVVTRLTAWRKSVFSTAPRMSAREGFCERVLSKLPVGTQIEFVCCEGRGD